MNIVMNINQILEKNINNYRMNLIVIVIQQKILIHYSHTKKEQKIKRKQKIMVRKNNLYLSNLILLLDLIKNKMLNNKNKMLNNKNQNV